MLVGREHETARLDALLADARDGRSGALVLRGEAGIGKTSLLDYAVERARDFRVLRASGIESESGLDFSALHQLLRPVLDLLDEVPARSAQALRQAFALGESESATVDPFLVYAGTLHLLAAAAEREPVLGLIDDAHWLDPASAEAVGFAARRFEADQVVLLFAARESAEARFEVQGIDELRIGGLTREASRELIDRSGANSIAPEVSATLIAATGGNPLALLEIPDALSSAQRAGREPLDDPLPVGESIERAFLARAQALSSETRQVLLVAAASDSGELDVIARAAGEAIDALDEAEQAGLVRVRSGEVAFRHPLVRSAVYSAVPAGARRAAHEALAGAFGPHDADRRAWHLAAAAIGPDEDLAAALEQAAGRARGRGGVAAEMRLLERSAALTPERDRRVPRLIRAGEAAYAAGWIDQSLALLDQGLRLVEDPLVRADLYNAYLFEARTRDTVEFHQTCLAEAERVELLDPVRAASLLFHAWWFLSTRLELDRARELAKHAWSLVEDRSGEDVVYALSLRSWQAVYDGRRELGVDLAERGAEIVAARSLPGGGGMAMDFVDILTCLEQYRIAGRLLARAVPAFRAEGQRLNLALALMALTMSELGLGRVARASAAASESVGLVDELRLDHLAAWALTRQVAVEAVQGRAEDCRAHVARVIELTRSSGDLEIEAQALDALGRLELGLGRSEEAIVALERVREMVGDIGNGTCYLLWRPDLIEAYVRADRLPEAAEELDAFAGDQSAELGPWATAAAARCQALLAGDGDLDEAFRQALERCGESVSSFERARTELAFGERLRRAGRRLDAREQLRAALHGFERLGASSWAGRAREELRASGETARKRDPALVDQLTPRELQIALQVADGATNREVAARLFLSPKTVELHLGRVYRKLRVRSRTELARLMPDQPPPD